MTVWRDSNSKNTLHIKYGNEKDGIKTLDLKRDNASSTKIVAEDGSYLERVHVKENCKPII